MARVQGKISPFLWFQTGAQSAAQFYTSIFKKSKILESDEMSTTFILVGIEFIAFNGGPQYEMTPAISFLVSCKDQKEVDYFWSKFSRGRKPGRCGWITDRFGVSWQIVPNELSNLLGDSDRKKADRALKAMLKMKKIDLKKLKKAVNFRVISWLIFFAFYQRSFASPVAEYSCHPDNSWSRCVKEQTFETFKFTNWIQNGAHLSARYASKAGSACANPGFPVIELKDSRVDNWIQIVEFHRSAPDRNPGPGFNISGNAQEWIMVDTSPKARKLGLPFARDAQKDSYFYDHPCWDLRVDDPLNWEAFLFPVKIENRNITPMGGLRWGYDNSPKLGGLTPKPLSEVKREIWDSFRLKLKATYPEWNFL